MEKWIRENFEVAYNEFDAYDFFVFYDKEEKTIEVHLPIFLSIFGDCAADYSSLKSFAEKNNVGWIKLFDDWKEQGILD